VSFSGPGKRSAWSTMIMAKLLGKFLRWLWRAVGLFAVWQTPLALFAKRQNEKVAERELVFVAICSDADGHGVLRHVAT